MVPGSSRQECRSYGGLVPSSGRLWQFSMKKGERFPPRPYLLQCSSSCYLNSAFWYSLFSLAMNLTLIPFGQAAWHS
jgi:hypothetical protein